MPGRAGASHNWFRRTVSVVQERNLYPEASNLRRVHWVQRWQRHISYLWEPLGLWCIHTEVCEGDDNPHQALRRPMRRTGWSLEGGSDGMPKFLLLWPRCVYPWSLLGRAALRWNQPDVHVWSRLDMRGRCQHMWYITQRCLVPLRGWLQQILQVQQQDWQAYARILCCQQILFCGGRRVFS